MLDLNRGCNTLLLRRFFTTRLLRESIETACAQGVCTNSILPDQDKGQPFFRPISQTDMDQSGHLANTEIGGSHQSAPFVGAAFDAQQSLIDSANEFAFSIDFQ
ncbi:hypothetical protein [Paraburkholderia ribeironis]|uniref:hypothetical protein n=1 Tax=Paraburkholderia ribeironis TaxID=1247936 RepID=UPI001177B5E4|nr:hypothetical protein [Paraburkholderia ribeironis]